MKFKHSTLRNYSFGLAQRRKKKPSFFSFKKLRWYLVPAIAFFVISAFKTVEILKTNAGHDPVPVEDFVNFESGHVHPLDMTPDGSKLLAVNTAANTLEVFTVTITGLVNTASIPVGMDPVTVRVRNNDEAWVANVISDNVSIVDLNQEVVVRTLWMDDMNEPSDIVFAGSPQKAFVSCAERESIFIFDLNNLDATPQEVLLVGEQPRAMAVSPDGNTVYTAFFESGNQTTVVAGNQFVAAGNLREPVGNRNTVVPNDVTRNNGPYGGAVPVPNDGNNFNPPMNPNLPNTSTFQSLVVKKDNSSGQWLDDNGGNWTAIVSGGQGVRQSGWDLQDRDVAVLNANSLNVSYQKHLGNILMAMGVNPVSGKVSVVGTDAMNHIRFTPNLNGTFLRVNISQFDQGNSNNDITDLNNHLNYSTPSVSPSERQKSVGDPRAIVWRSNGQEAYISGMGSNNVIIVDANGDRLNAQPIEVGQGPTGIVLDESNSKVYVLNKFDASISTVDMNTDQEIAQTSFFDPTPNEIKIGRPHMYDTHLGSGNGTISCASCHVDGKWDRLAWDLGDPSGNMETVNGVQFHPLKGLKVTQSLIDIINVGDGLLHWRGDIDDFEDFASAFDALQGTSGPLPSAEMQEFEDFLSTTYHPPNPYRGHRFNVTGFGFLNQDKVRGPGTSGFIRSRFATNNDFANRESVLDSNYGFLCGGCHELGSGRGSTRYNGNENMSADLRTTYRKLGFYLNSTESTAGFGMLADGILDTDLSCVGGCTNEYFIDYEPVLLTFAGGSATDRDLSQANTQNSPFGRVIAHESQDSHGATGHQATLSPNAGTTAAVNNVRNLANEYTKLGLIVKGIYQGDLRGFLYLGNNTYQADSAGQTVTHNQLLSAAQNGGALTWMVVHNDIAERLGIDRNSNGVFDFDETISADFTFNREEPYDIPALVDFDASSSNNPIGNSTSFAWNFGDGNTGSGINPTHSYAVADTFTVTLTVTDDNSGESDVVSKRVIIIEGCAALVGQSCNDPCMPDGIIQPDCSCLGTPTTDSDGDGVCDATDQCPNFDNNLIGTSCDDGDVCTINDTWLSDCNCTGTVVDTDSDGICDGIDIDDDNDGITDQEEGGCDGGTVAMDNLNFSGSAVRSSTSTSLELNSRSGYTTSYSTETFELPVHLEFRFPGVGEQMFGFLPLGATQTPNTWNDGAYKFYASGRGLYGKFPTTWNPSNRAFNPNDLLEIDIDANGNLEAKHAGTVVATATLSQTEYSLAITTRGSVQTVSDIVLSYKGGECEELDTDGDNIVDRLDLDSDGDGCSDLAEAGAGLVSESLVTENASFTSVGANGLADHLETSVDSDEPNYDSRYTEYALEAGLNGCADTDGDGVGDPVDIDDDNDGITDIVENGCAGGTTEIDEMTFSGSAIVSSTSNSMTLRTGNTWRSSYSSELLELPIHLEFTMPASGNIMFGLLPEGATQTPSGWSDGSYKYYLGGTGLYGKFPTAWNPSNRPYRAGQLLEIDIAEDGSLIASHAGTVVFTGTAPQSDYQLVVSSYDGRTISDIALSHGGGDCGQLLDTDGDGIANQFDLDSDGDGCSDMAEAGSGLVTESLVTESSSFTSVGANGLADHLETNVDSDEINYNSSYGDYALLDSVDACQDSDGDGIGDIADRDDDNDGITDLEEANCSNGGVADMSELSFNGSAIASATSNSLNLSAPQSYITSYSNETFELPIHLEFRMAQSSEQMFGLIPEGGAQTVNSWNDGSYKFYVSGASLYGKFPTAWNPSARSFSASHLLEIDIDENGNFTATQNGTVVFSGTAPQVDYRLAVTANRGNAISDITLSHAGGECTDLNLDTDGDGIVNSLDLDSDGDGCSDAFEGAAGFTAGDLNSDGSLAGSVNTDPNSEAYGVPTIANLGQEFGTSQDSSNQPANCPSISQNQAPVAAFTATPTNGEAPLPVSFDANGSSDDVGIVNYAWNFGDGTTGNGVTATHTYAAAGSYTASLVVSDQAGLTDTQSRTITVTDPVITPPDSGDCFMVNTLNEVWIEAEHYSAQAPGTGTASGSSWSKVADSTASNDSALVAGPNAGVFTDLNINGPRLDYKIYFDSPGNYAVFIRAFGASGADDSFHAGLNGNSLTSDAGYGMSVPPSWTWAEEANDGLDVVLSIPSPGTYTLNIWMREDGVQLDKIFLIPVGGNGPFEEGEEESEVGPCGGSPANTAPVAKLSATPTNGEGPLEVSFDGSSSTDDKGISTYAWDFGDGNTGNGATATHTYALAGSYTASLTVSDQEGLTDVKTIAITVTETGSGDCFIVASNGEVWIEAENFSAQAPGTGNASASSWLSYSDGTASNGSAMRAEPNDGVYTGLAANGPRLDYKIYFETPGSYSVYVRGSGLSGSDDSFHAGLNGNPLTTTAGYGMSVPTSWTWADEANDGIDLVLNISNAGQYTFNLWMREDGVSVDKIMISSIGRGPSGIGQQESSKGDCGGQVSNQAPVASFTATPPSGPAPLAVNFDANASTDDKGIVSYTWDFGDGAGGTGVGTTHSYTSAGQFTASLTVADQEGLTHSITTLIEVENPSSEDCFAELNGEVVIEAENFSNLEPGSGNAGGSSWSVITDGNASGGEALEATPNSGVYTGLNINGPRLDYNIDFSETGVYRIYVLTSAPGPNDDSYHVGLNGSSVSSNSGYGMGRNGPWGWADYANEDDFVEVNVPSVGKHTFNVWMREDGVKIDKIILSKSNYPFGQGPAESGQSPCGGDANQAPVSSFSATPSSGFAPLAVSIDASSSTDPDGSIASYAWTFGDGTSGNGQTLSHTYTNVGTFTLTLAVTDNEGLSNQSSRTITVSPQGNGPLCHQESAGVVVLEAENYTATSTGSGNASGSSWQKFSDPATSNGEGVRAMPNSGVYTGLNTNGPRLDYDITFQTAGTYRVYIRANGPTGSDDSFHAGLNGQSVTSASAYGMGYTGNWFWAEEANEDPFVEVVVPNTGQHTFNIWMREDGVEIDKIVLKISASTPSGQGPTESPLAECSDPSFNNESFSVQEEGGNADINWGNFFEEFKDNQVLERSIDGISYELLQAEEISVDKILNAHTDPDIHQYDVNKLYYRLRIKDSYGRTRKERSGILNLRTAFVSFALKAYPNPAKDKLNVEYDNSSGQPLNLKVMSALGQTVHQETLDGQETHGIIKLNVESYAEGVYFVQLTDGENSQVIRILVE